MLLLKFQVSVLFILLVIFLAVVMFVILIRMYTAPNTANVPGTVSI